MRRQKMLKRDDYVQKAYEALRMDHYMRAFILLQFARQCGANLKDAEIEEMNKIVEDGTLF